MFEINIDSTPKTAILLIRQSDQLLFHETELVRNPIIIYENLSWIPSIILMRIARAKLFFYIYFSFYYIYSISAFCE